MNRSSSKTGTFQTGIRTGLLLGALSCSLSAALAQESAKPGIVETCSECHGSDGIGFKAGIPHLNGQLESLLVDMLGAYKQGTRPTKVKMHRDIPATDVALLAKHYAQQKAQRPKLATKPELVARGEVIHNKACSDCHVENGRESDKEAPLTAGQDLDYLIAQTLAFKSGERKFPVKMDEAYQGLTEEDLTAVAHFFASQEQAVPKKRRRRF